MRILSAIMIFYDAKELPLKQLPHERSLKLSWILNTLLY